MAQIAFPLVPLSSLDLSLDWPGQSVHSSLYTGNRQVITRGIGVWTGSMTWAARGRVDNAAEIGQIEGFINSLEGASNTFDIPIPVNQANRFNLVPSADPDAYLTVRSNIRTGSQSLMTFNRTDGLRAGDYVTIDSKLFQFTGNLAGFNANLTPYRLLPAMILPVIWTRPYLRARRTSSDPISMNRDVDWWGPVTVEFTQATEA